MSVRVLLVILLVLLLFLVACGQGGVSDSVSIKVIPISNSPEAVLEVTVKSQEGGTVDLELTILPVTAANLTDHSWVDLPVEGGIPTVVTTTLMIDVYYRGNIYVYANLEDTRGIPRYGNVRVSFIQDGITPYYEETPIPDTGTPQVVGSVEVTSLDPHHSQMRRC